MGYIGNFKVILGIPILAGCPQAAEPPAMPLRLAVPLFLLIL
jgi:hypothetical protein